MRFWRRSKSEEPSAGEAVAGGQDPHEAAIAVADPARTQDAGLGTQDPGLGTEDSPTEEAREIQELTDRALERTKRGLFGRIGALFERADFSDHFWDELEEILIASDTGLATTQRILDDVRKRVKSEGIKQSRRVREVLREELVAILEA